MIVAQRISIALCTCNGSRFIEEQIESICRQTLPAAEIVLRDDASDDDTIARAVAAWQRCQAQRTGGTPELKIAVHPQRLGIAPNFASAIAGCAGDLIALSDQDDRWHPERLERLVARMQAQPTTLLLHGNAWLVNGNGRSLGNTLFQALGVSDEELRAIAEGRALDVFLDRNLVTGAATIFRRDLLTAALPFPAHWLHDEWLGAIAAALGGVDVETVPLLDYRQHGGNQIGAHREGLFDSFRRATGARVQWHMQRLLRARELQGRLETVPSVPIAVLDAVRDKVAHHKARAAFPAQRIRRPIAVWREWGTGRYRRFGRGLRGAVKDLLERA